MTWLTNAVCLTPSPDRTLSTTRPTYPVDRRTICPRRNRRLSTSPSRCRWIRNLNPSSRRSKVLRTARPPPSSSGEISEADEFGPLPGLGHAGNGGDMHDLHSVSEASDMDHLRVSSASSLVGLPQAQLLSSNDLESINIDDFLKSANESTAALEHQLHASMAMEPKSVPAQDMYAVSSQSPSYNNKPLSNSIPSPPDSVPLWPGNLFDAGSTPPMDDGYFRQAWAQ